VEGQIAVTAVGTRSKEVNIGLAGLELMPRRINLWKVTCIYGCKLVGGYTGRNTDG